MAIEDLLRQVGYALLVPVAVIESRPAQARYRTSERLKVDVASRTETGTDAIGEKWPAVRRCVIAKGSYVSRPFGVLSIQS